MWSNTRITVQRLAKALNRHGFLGTARLAIRYPFAHRAGDRAERRAIREQRRMERQFDRQFGVSTAGRIPLSALEIASENTLHGSRYGPTRQDRFHRMLSLLPPVDYREYVFLDLGSGKGTALLLAAELPFRRIIGVEFSPELHQVAQENIRRSRSRTRQCQDVQSVCMDATAFPLPDEPLICFLFNPFGAPVMARFLANLRQSLQRCPRDVFILYQLPMEAHLMYELPRTVLMMDECGFLTRLAVGEYYAIYRSGTEARTESLTGRSDGDAATPRTDTPAC